MALDPTHLIERAAERLRNAGGGLSDASAMPARPPSARPPSARPPEPPPSRLFAPPPAMAAASAAIQAVAGGAVQLAEPPPTPGATSVTEASVTASSVTEASVTETGIISFARLEAAGLVVGRKTRTRISEEFRISVGQILRTIQTDYSSGNASANLLMLTSARPGEGKSFSALNIAGSIAQHGQREVLLVDVDAKQRPITHELGLGEAPGLLDLAANPGLRIEEVIVRTAIPNLAVLPIGTRVVDTAGDATTTRPISAVVERLGRRFPNRVILLDAPPCLSTSDPSALAPLVGQIIMVVEAERTQRNEVEAAFDLIKACPNVTLLLNKIKLTTSYTFGAYHYFGSYS